VHEQKDSRDVLVERMRAVKPASPSREAADRVRMRVLGSVAAAPTTKRPRVWRIAGSVATAAVLIAVALVVLAPRIETAAFARDKAADALMFNTPGRVFHMEMTYTHEADDLPKNEWLNQRWSLWVDSEGRRLREQFVNASDDSLADMKVWIDDRALSYAYMARNNKQSLIDFNYSGTPLQTVMEDEISNMRMELDNGDAKVTGAQLIDGDEYWVVECDYYDDRGDIESITTMTMRKSDYRLKTWQRKSFSKDGTGAAKVTRTKRIVFNVIEQLEPSALPEDFFSFDAVTDAVRPGIPVEKH